MQSSGLKAFILTLTMVVVLSGCGGGGGGDSVENINKILQADGRYKGDLYLSADTCQHDGILETLPYEIDIRPTNLTSGPSHVIDVIGDNMSAVNAYDDGNTAAYGNIYNSDLSNFFANYNCSENITLNLWSPENSATTSSLVKVERSSNIYCVNKDNPDDTRTCDVYYIGEIQLQP